MADYTYWNKWSTPIWVSQDPDYDRFSKGMVRECLEFSDGEDRTEVAGTIKGKLYESDFNFFSTARRKNYNSITHIEEFITNQFRTCFLGYFRNHFPETTQGTEHLQDIEESNIDVNMRESWVHISNGQGSWHGSHDHPRTSWGVIYYVQIDDTGDDNGGTNTFRQPFQNMYKDDGNFFQHSYSLFTPPMNNGGVVFFPANLIHNASPYYGNQTRIVIAANICVNFKR